MKESKTIIFWGVLDLLALSWYVLWRIAHRQLPFYYDIAKASENTAAFGVSTLIIIPIITIIIYISFAFSGILLIRKNKAGAIISYIQTPFRILTLVPPSIFFITWPLKFIFSNPRAIHAIVTLIILILLSEVTKVYTLRNWKKLKRTA